MVLKPQDIVILLKLITLGRQPWSYNTLAHALAMSPSEAHGGLKRAGAARLYDAHRKAPVIRALQEFLEHGVKYAYAPDRGGLTRGIPTCYAGPPLHNLIVQPDEPPPVWPTPDGTVRGYAFSPLYRSVPQAVTQDQALYELLTLVDAIRDGRARERELAITLLKERLETEW